MFQHDDYREILRAELAKRCRQNPRYSQGAFARDISIPPSRLSEIFNGKQGLSQRAARAIARHLNFSATESDFFADLVESVHGRSRATRENATIRLRRYRSLNEESHIEADTFRVIADWYHLAIVELSRLEHFVSEPEWIASALKVPLETVWEALERLLRLGLLIERQGSYEATRAMNIISHDFPTSGMRKFTRQMLDKAKEAVGDQPLHERVNQTYLLPVDSSRIAGIKADLDKVLRQLAVDLHGKDPSPDAVFCFSGQFFRVAGVPPGPGKEVPPAKNRPDENPEL